ncbi:small ribosomal subunit Rsm22 family protein [Halomicrobium sp. HM KBTZ05]|uniref:small ribosomal subunit Rsm22 family protein n=1 Tax=Halomicrobium sp. HM KBTZ05 TaxID=3242663 RepID=UPI0035562C6D
MNDETRDSIRSNAKYLRQVRPIDPEEICEYVDGQPHPAVVRRVLREEAFDLGLVEREDGTFEPIGDEPPSPAFEGVDALPPEHVRRLEDLLVEREGVGWPDGETGDRLRERIRAIKERYLQQQPVEYDDLTALAYAIYHLPDYYAVTQYVIADLLSDGLLDRQIRVLDVGAGVGGPALGLLDLLGEECLVDYHAVEPSAAADVLGAMLETTPASVQTTTHRTTVESFEPDDQFDLVVCANVLNELDEPASVVERALDWLAPAGSLAAIEPADRNTAIGLREIERAVADDGPATVYSPTVRLWAHESPTSESWSFDVRPDIDVPPFQRRLDEGASGPDHQPGEFVNVDVQYAYSILRTDGRTAIDARGNRSQVAKMAEADSYVTDRINLLGVKLSGDLTEAGNPLYLIGDGSQSTDHFAVLTEESILNEDLRGAAYGDLLLFENALVLWNDDEGAYNVVVDGETVVDRVPA